MKKQQDLTQGNILKVFCLFALPLFFSSLFQQLYGTVDLLFVGEYLGKQETAAVGASGIIVTCMIGIFTGVSVGTGVIVSQFRGAKDTKNIRLCIKNAYLLSLFGGAVITIAGLLFSEIALKLLNTPENIMAPALTYMRIYLLAVIPMIFYNISSGILRALGDSKTPFQILATGGILNVILDGLFIAVLKWGVAGVAIATLLAQTFTAVIAFGKVLHSESCTIGHEPKRNVIAKMYKFEPDVTAEPFVEKTLAGSLSQKNDSYKTQDAQIPYNSIIELEAKRIISPDFKMIKRILTVGVPLGLQSMIITFSNLAVQYNINGFGEDAVAAFAIYFKAENLIYLPILAFGQAMITFTGQNYGAGLKERIRKGVISCNLLSMGVTAVISAIVLLLGRQILGLFSDDLAVIEEGLKIIRVSFPFYFLYAVLEVTGAVVRGIGKTTQSMFIIICNLCVVRITILGIFTAVFHSIRWVAAVYPITWCLTAVSFVIYYRMCAKKYLS